MQNLSAVNPNPNPDPNPNPNPNQGGGRVDLPYISSISRPSPIPRLHLPQAAAASISRLEMMNELRQLRAQVMLGLG